MPFRGDVRSAPVPGCVDGWLALHDRFGRLPLADVLAPAISLAEDGHELSPLLAFMIPSLAGIEGCDELVDADPDASTLRRPGARPPAADDRGRGSGRPLPRRVRPRPPRRRRRRVHRGRPCPEPGRLGGRPRPRRVGPPGLDRPAQLAGLPRAGRRRHRRAGRPARRSGRRPAGPTCSVEAARLAGYDRPEVLHDAADGARAARPPTSSTTRARRIDPDRATDVGLAHRSRRDHLPVHRRRRGQRGEPDPVERLRLRQPRRGARHRGAAAQPGHRVLPPSRPPGRVRPRSPAAAHALPRPRHRTRAASCGRCSGRWAATRSPRWSSSCWPACSGRARTPARSSAPPAGCSAATTAPASTCGTAAGPAHVRIEAHAPAAWAEGLSRRGHDVRRAGQDVAGFGHAHLIDLTPDRPRRRRRPQIDHRRRRTSLVNLSRRWGKDRLWTVKSRRALLHLGGDRLDLVGAADQLPDGLGLREERLGPGPAGRRLEQGLRAPDRVRVPAGDLPGQAERVGPRVLGQVGGEAELEGLGAARTASP